jgi:hypothetical protein
MPKATASKAVAKKDAALPAYLSQAEQRGAENVTTEDLQLPRIKMLQALSPEISKKSTKIAGAEIGMFMNTLTGALSEELTIVPVFFYKKYLVWADKDRRPERGLIGVYDSDAEGQEAKEEHDDKVSLTPTHICLVINDDGTLDEVSLPMPSTKIKVSKSLNSLVRMGKVDSFAKSYTLSAVEESNAKGDYSNMKFTPNAGFVEEAVYRQAEALYESLSSGAVKLSDSSIVEDDGDIPF